MKSVILSLAKGPFSPFDLPRCGTDPSTVLRSAQDGGLVIGYRFAEVAERVAACSIFFLLVSFLSLTQPLPADDTGETLLAKPETGLIELPAQPGGTTLAPTSEGTPLSFATPQILIHKTTEQAEFISAVWKDAAGQPIHQRDVFVAKPDYGVIVDYIYAKGKESLLRSLVLAPAEKITVDEKGVTWARTKNYRVQSNDAANASPDPSAAGTVRFSSIVTTPTPLSTVFCTWTGPTAPKVDFVKANNPMIVKFNVTFPDGRVDHVGLGWEARPLHLNAVELHGWAAVLRQTSTGTTTIEIN